MTFMLDTDTVSLILRDEGETATHFRATPRHETCLSSLTSGELRCGVSLRQSRRLAALVDTFVSAIRIAAFDAEAAGRFGTLAADLSNAGAPRQTRVNFRNRMRCGWFAARPRRRRRSAS